MTLSDSIHSAIQRRAYFLWKRNGCPEGRALDFWLTAEFEIAVEEGQKYDF